MKLIADSGSTKTDWALITETNTTYFTTHGINPTLMPAEQIEIILTTELLSHVSSVEIVEIHFYGAGCIDPHTDKLTSLFQILFPKAAIHIFSDLLGAARALFGKQAGIACILGTGANSCVYDGKHIVDNIPPLGFILGDEGSGAYLGKRFINCCIKRQLPPELLEGLYLHLNLTYPELIQKVYREPNANRFLASITPYIYLHKSQSAVHSFLIECFEDFLKKNILPYQSTLPLAFIGSIAFYFETELRIAAEKQACIVSHILAKPIEALVKFHSSPLSY